MRIFSLIILLLSLANCSPLAREHSLHKQLSKEDSKNINYKGHYKIAKPYKTNKAVLIETGIASWYGGKDGFHRKKTANGDQYNKYALSAASRTLPLPSLVRVTNLQNKKALIVMVNDRGPRSKQRIIDVSERAAMILGFKKAGLAKVKVEYLPKDTNEFLKKISLTPKHGSKVNKKTKANGYCSINCHVKLFNMKHKLPLNIIN